MPIATVAAIIKNEAGKILLTHRNVEPFKGQWCLPGGAVDPGESVTEACEREVFEETGLSVRVKRLVGVYSHPDQLTAYSETDKFQIVALHFEAEIIGGELGLSDETTDFGYFTVEEVDRLEMLGRHRERILDTLANQKDAFIR